MPRRRRPETFECPHCGAEVRVGAAACPECGSDDDTGWSEGADAWDADLPAGHGEEDDDFDYDEFVAREFPGRGDPDPGRSIRRWAWRAVVALACLALIRYFLLI